MLQLIRVRKASVLILMLTISFGLAACTEGSSRTKVKGAQSQPPSPQKPKPGKDKPDDGKNEDREVPSEGETPTAEGEAQKPEAQRTEVTTEKSADGVEGGDPDEDQDEVNPSKSKPAQGSANSGKLSTKPVANVIETGDDKSQAQESSLAEKRRLQLLQVVAALRAGHEVFSEATRIHFKVQDASEASMSLLKELSWFLAAHIENETVNNYYDGCGSSRLQRKSLLRFTESEGSSRLDLYSSDCAGEGDRYTFTAELRDNNSQIKIRFMTEEIPSTAKSWIHLLGSTGQCSFTVKPGVFNSNGLVMMDCGASEGKQCAVAAHSGMRSYKGLAMGIKSTQAGQTRIALFERLFHRALEKDGKVEVGDFYACGHSFLQKRQSGGLDFHDLEFSVLGTKRTGGKLQVRFDYRAAEEEAHRKAELAEEERETAAHLAGQKAKSQEEKGEGASADQVGTAEGVQSNPVKSSQPAAPAILCPSASDFEPISLEELDQLNPEELVEYQTAYKQHMEKVQKPCDDSTSNLD